METPRIEHRKPSTRGSRPGRVVASLLVILVAGLLPPSLTAQEPDHGEIGDACAAEAFRAFDYWLGEWAVRNDDGEQVGSSRVTRVSAGCALLEEWMPVQGPRGTSINFLDPRSDTWRQTWVGGGGMVLDLEGAPADGVMTLHGERDTPEGPVEDRIRWIPLDDGRVEQRWDVSEDGGETWETIFRGWYEPAGP